jgi:hypothetical protein
MRTPLERQSSSDLNPEERKENLVGLRFLFSGGFDRLPGNIQSERPGDLASRFGEGSAGGNWASDIMVTVSL